MAHRKSHELLGERLQQWNTIRKYGTPTPILLRKSFKPQAAQMSWQKEKEKIKHEKSGDDLCIELADHIYAVNTCAPKKPNILKNKKRNSEYTPKVFPALPDIDRIDSEYKSENFGATVLPIYEDNTTSNKISDKIFQETLKDIKCEPFHDITLKEESITYDEIDQRCVFNYLDENDNICKSESIATTVLPNYEENSNKISDKIFQDTPNEIKCEPFHDISLKEESFSSILDTGNGKRKVVRKRNSSAKHEALNETKIAEFGYSTKNKSDNKEKKAYYCSEFILQEGLKKRYGCNGKPYICPVPGCNKTYKNPNGIKYHAQYGHSEKQEFACTCGKIYTTRHGLMAHKKSHTNPREKQLRSKKVKYTAPVTNLPRTTYNSQVSQLNWKNQVKQENWEENLCIELADHIYAVNTCVPKRPKILKHIKAKPEFQPKDLITFPEIKPSVAAKGMQNAFQPTIKYEYEEKPIFHEINQKNIKKESISPNPLKNKGINSGNIDIEKLVFAPFLQRKPQITEKVATPDTLENDMKVVIPNSPITYIKEENLSPVKDINNYQRDFSEELTYYSTPISLIPYKLACNDSKIVNGKSEFMDTDCWNLCFDTCYFDASMTCNSNKSLQLFREDIDLTLSKVCEHANCYELFTTEEEYDHHIRTIHPEGTDLLKYFELVLNDMMNPNSGPTDLSRYFPDTTDIDELESECKSENTTANVLQNCEETITSSLMSDNEVFQEAPQYGNIFDENHNEVQEKEINTSVALMDAKETNEDGTTRIFPELPEKEESQDVSKVKDISLENEKEVVSNDKLQIQIESRESTEIDDENPGTSIDETEDNKYYSSEFILQKGLKKRSGSGKPYMCPVPNCNKTYKNPNGIKYHAQYGHSKRQEFPCHCGKIYTTRHGLLAHSKSHENQMERQQRSRRAKVVGLRRSQR